MKRYIKSSIILLAALAFASCSKIEEFQGNPDSVLQIESVSGISPFTLMQNPVSKAVITGESLPGDEAAKGIGLFVTESNGGAYDGKTTGYSNVKYAYGSEKWSAASPIYLSNTTGKLYAYFPYSADATNITAIPVESSLNGTDYLYATSQDVSFSNKSVNLQMNHALARLHLTIKKGDKYLSNCNLSKIVLQSKAIDASGTMDITTGVITATKAADATGTFTLTGSDAVTAAGITKDILLVPASAAEGKKDLTLTLTIDGIDAVVSFTADKGLDIRSGIQCNATLTIEDTGIKVTGVGVGVWGDGGSQTVQVSGYTVTVKLDEMVVPNDILTDIHIEGQSSVIIKATSVQKRALSCNVGDLAQCQRDKDNGIYTFTISNISSNVEVVLSYSIVTITVSSDSNGKVWIGDDESKTCGQFYFGQQVVIHAAPNDKFRLFRWNDNNRETTRTVTVVGEDDAEYSANFISSDLIPGKFTVSDGKQVFFSKGNLWCSTDSNPQASDFHFETNQYDTTPSSDGDRDNNHISHFMWSSSVETAIQLKYDSDLYKETEFFTDNSFTVNGVSTWRSLTGGNYKEWQYLIDRKDNNGKDLHKTGVTICGHTNCLILLPDDWKWGENSVGDNWQSEYSESTDVKWSTMENAGAVCLPAAGYRSGNDGSANVSNVGSDGYYWSSTRGGGYGAVYHLHFSSSDVAPSSFINPYYAFAVRLVIGVK